MKAVVAAFNQENALVGAFWMDLFEALLNSGNNGGSGEAVKMVDREGTMSRG